MTPTPGGTAAERLLKLARAAKLQRSSATAPIEPVARGGTLALSFAQQRLWFLEQLGTAGSAYHVSTRLHLRGELDREALVCALERMLARHEALRTTFSQVDGQPVQRVLPAGESTFRLVDHDLSGHGNAGAELGRVMADEAGTPFDLERGPLVRGRLIRLAEDDHVLLVTMHHIVSDGWSMEVFTREATALYDAFRRGEPDPLPPLPVQYADYAAWQRKWVDGEVLRAQVEYWKRTLSGAPELLELPTDRPRPARQDHAGALAGIDLGEELSAGLRALSQRHGTTLFMTLLAGWAVVLGRLSGHPDVVVGTPSANRRRKEIEGLIGFFVNTLALRVDLSGSPSVTELLERVKERSLGAQYHQDIPFEQVVELVQPARSLAYSPLVQVLFSWQGASQAGAQRPAPARVAGAEQAAAGRVAGAERTTAKFDLSLTLGERGGRIAGSLAYATALYDRATAERYLGYLRRVLEAMVADDHQGVDALPLLPDAERRLVMEEWNATGAAYPSGRVHELFAAQAARTPGAVAVVFGAERVTYAELDARANRLAHRLCALGVGPDGRVGLFLERSVEAVVGVLAILKAGGAYVALDPSYPDERLRFMLRDAEARALVTRTALEGRLAGWGGATVRLDADAEAIARESAAAPAVSVSPENLAYVIYTSGSTGEPKGVLIEHGGLSNYLAFFDREILGEGFALPMVSRLSFDAHVRQLYPPLLRGEAVWVLPEETVSDPAAILEALASRERVSFGGVPSLWGAVLDAIESGAHQVPGDLRAVLLGGEALPPELVRRTLARFPGVRIWNHYGPTEATVNTTVARVENAERVTLGRPVANVRVYLLDANGNPVPVGVAGELYVGGVGVSRGYLGRPGLTAEKYLPDPFPGEPGARMYRSGDRVRWLADGELEYLGRVDHQVKVRGFRIELGEIESRLRQHAEVRDAVVAARDDMPLVAYYVGGAVEAEALRAHLATSLPEHMVPAAYVRLEALPLTPNGKVDRKALPSPEGDAYVTRAFEAPLGAAEEALAEIWSDVLGIGRIGRHDHFFELGGHSLRAVQVISRVRQTLGVQAALADVFLRPVLADFARGLEQAGRADLPPIERVERSDRLPLSFAQQRLWFLEQMGGMGSTYHIPKRLRLRGELDRAALARALDRIVERHEALRTTFVEMDGEPVQRITGESRFHLVEHDLSAHPDGERELRRLAGEEAHALFDLRRGPLIRGRLVRLAEDDHVLLLTMHHIVSDGWSSGVLTNELSTLYGAFREGRPDPLPPLPVQYADYAAWQRKWVEGEVLREQAEYWKQVLSGAPELLELPTDRPRPARQDHVGASAAIDLGDELSAGLRALSQRHGTTLFMTLLAGWGAVLGRLSGQDDVVVGTPSANRGRREIEGLIGFFVNTLALRIELGGSPSVSDLLARVRERALGAQQHQDIPFEQVVELVQPVRSMAHTPLFQVMFAWQNASEGRLELPGLRLGGAGAGAASQTPAKFDLSLTLGEAGGRITGSITYATALFEQATIERHLAYLRRVLEAFVADDGQRVNALSLLPESERRLVVEEWNATAAAYPRTSCIHELFEAQVERTPGAVAVVFEDLSLTYAELDARANRLAHHLAARGVCPDARVAICMDRGLDMVAGLLAVLKSGGAYVPLDPAYPDERLRYMVADSTPALLLTQASLQGRFEDFDLPLLRLDTDAGAWAEQPETNPGRAGLSPAHTAYVIYTSGSTGRPKGVVVPHRGVVHYTTWAAATYANDAPKAFPLYSSIAFDLTVTSVFVPLATGGTIVVYGEREGGDPVVLRVIGEDRADAAKVTPAHLALLQPGGAAPRRLGTLVVGGEDLKVAVAEAARRALGGVEIYNEYGPTEATVGCMIHRFDAERDRGASVPIGRAIANSQIYVLDRCGEPVPLGVPGEIHIGGVQLARGYLNGPGLTAERFVPDAFGREAGARLYRTGDLARWRADGTLEYLGRNDFQVKVRGFRIELGEIEARLAEHPEVREAVVLARQDGPGDTRLVAYAVGPDSVAANALRAYLAERLPEHMVPAAYVRLDALPLTPNGKVDRKALPAPEGDAYARRGYEAPVGETEQALAEVWSELLGVERVGRWDNFFELGGHSLLAVRVISRVRQVLGAEVGIGGLFERPVLADFARGVQEAARTNLPPIEPVERSGALPLSFAQQRLWFLEQMGGMGSTYHIPRRLRLRGGLDGTALARALERIVERHEALRTTFHAAGGEPVQRIAPAGESGFQLAGHDLSAHPDAGPELRRLMDEEARAPFDLERGPLVRGRLVRLAEDDHVLLLTMHHIVSDGWSSGVLTNELATLYAAFRRGQPDPLPPLPVQYADYAAWQRKWVDGEVLREQAKYWKGVLGGAPALLELPADRPRPPRQNHVGATAEIDLGDELSAALKALSRRHGTTLFMTLLAGWAAVLGRLSGQDDVVVGTPSANRGRREIEGLIGFFVNTLALRIEFGGSPSVSDLLRRVRERALEAQQNQDIPFEQVVELVQPARTLAHSPLFQVMFGWQNASEGGLELPGLRLGSVAVGTGAASQPVAKFDLSLTLSEQGGRIVGSLTYATALFEQATVERHLAYLRRVLEAFAADDLQAVDALPLLPDAERRLVVEEWSAGEAAHPSELCIHELFEAQARLTPGAVAVVHADETLAYAELDARANRLAHHLRSLGVGSEARVGVCLEWGPELVAALLAVLKAGGVYVPLDPSLPDERLTFMAEDADVAVLVTRDALAGRVAAGVTVRVDADAERIAAERDDAPASVVRPEGLAYLIYTSGSTGRPKGVAVEHRAAAAHFRAMAGALGIVREDRVLQFASSGFDVSLEQVFNPLLTGATLVLRGAELWSPAEFAGRAQALGVTVANLPPAYWQEVLATGALPQVRLLLVGGDALPTAAAGAGAGTRLLNCYGPTEAVVTATAFAVPEGFVEGFAGSSAPIGRPLPGRSAYVLDARGAPVPAGVAGELFLGGLLARGYLDRPGLTAERFVPDPFGGVGARLYRTGDRARWLADGTIEFLGRVDFQVKVRGFRIELGEIEARLREYPSVREAVVVPREVMPGDTRLVAYVIGSDSVESDALRAHLAERLPEYMVPAAYVRLDALPLTPSGKVDRKALPAPEGDAFATRGYEAPVGETEEALAEIFAEMLGVERVGRRDHFFELGGHSLLAVRVISRVRQVLGAEVRIGDLFERPVLADLARAIGHAERSELPPIERVDRAGRLPLSFAQQRLWFLEQMGGMGSTYHIPRRLRLRGELDGEALARALERIVERHEALRTTFHAAGGEPEQRIAPAGESGFQLAGHDLSAHPDAEAELRRLIGEEARAPFDLEGGPLVRGRLVRLAANDHVLLLTMHHIVSDGWSSGVLTNELATLYAAFRRGQPDPLPPLPVQYADYAAWQRKWVDGEVLREQAKYWKGVLGGAPALLELPADRPRPPRQNHVGATAAIDLGDELSAALKALSRRHGTTLFMTLLAGWAAVLGRLSGQEDVVVGTPSANRGRREIEGLIGFFVNTLALRIELGGSPSVSGLLRRVRERALGAQQHQDIPFEQVVELVQPARSMAHAPLFQVTLGWQNASESRLELPGLTLGGVASASQPVAKFDLSLALGEAGGRITGSITYATSLFEQATIERQLAYLRRVLEAMAADDLQAVDALPLLPEAERRLVVEEWSRTEAASASELCIHEMFEAHVRRTPGAAALVHADEALTYAELDAPANRLAHHLRSLGVGPEARVGIFLEWGPELVAALLAVLKAGGVYVPLDPSLPDERLAFMAEDADVAVLVTRDALAGRVAAGATVRVDADAERIAAQSSEPPASGIAPESLAYLIYTSGSTGRPKGVAVEHRAAAAHFRAMAGALGIVREDRVLQFASAGFDVSLEQVFNPLLTGATLVLRGAELWSPAEFADRTRALGVTVANLPPAYWQEVLATGALPQVRLLLVGGDALPTAAARAGDGTRLLNCYGPTEAVVTATAFAVPGGFVGGFAGSTTPIGRPLPGRGAYVLDARGAPVPAGVAGELFLGGLLARGYLDRPGLTAERFVPDPFGDAGARLYRTGDRARWRESGEVNPVPDSRTDALTHSRTAVLEFLGRVDFQVKVRGFRIELGEIEARLREHASVREAVVVPREVMPGDTRLVAYVVESDSVEADALRAHLAERLPEYMVPAAYVRLDALPLTPSGKVDRKALPAPEGDAFATRGYEAPVGETEEALAEIFAEMLGVERVGRRDHFFELGGHSLLAVRVISRVRQVLGAEVRIGDLFERPVLADLARAIGHAARTELPPIERVDRAGRLPLSFAQQRLWFLEQLDDLGSTYHIPTRMRLQGEMDGAALRRALDAIVARHEALRTAFVEVGGEPVQRIAPADAGFHLVEHDLDGHPDAAAELRRLAAQEAGARFDLEQGPLIRGRLVRLAEDDHVLLMTMHHIVSDGWSMGVLTRELGTLYQAFRRGGANPLPPLPVQYADYAAWQRKWVAGEVLREQAAYWKQALSGAPALLELPADRPRPARQDHAGGTVGIDLGEELAGGLRELSRRHGTTLFMTLLAGWAAVLARLSGQDDVVVGTPTANRGRTEIEGLIGFFVNTLALRVDLSERPTVAELLEQVRSRALGAQQHQDIPFEQVVELVQPARSMAHAPLFQVMFAWQNAAEGRPELPGLRLGGVASASRPVAKFDLSLALGEAGGRITGSITYATSLFDKATIERQLVYLRRVLEAFAAGDPRAVHALPLLPESERQLVVKQWNRTEAAYPRDRCIHELFEAWAERTPDAVAVVFGEEEALSYAELNRRANRLAHHLRSLGVEPDARVAICVERSPEMVVAVLGVLKAGGAYVPLDPGYPVERLRYMLGDSAPAVVLTQSTIVAAEGGLFARLGAEVLALDAPAWREQPATNPERGSLTPDHLAYVIYTSGSTGTPKGVTVAHRNVACLAAQDRALGLDATSRVLQFASFSFDASVFEMVTALCTGASLHVPQGVELLAGEALERLLDRGRITHVTLPPAVLPTLPEAARLASVNTMLLAGESVPAAAVRRWAGGRRLLNAYGPTEAAVWTTAHECRPGESGNPPIGRPIANARVYVLDEAGEPVPVGVAGELYIGGAGVARGYLGRPDLTAERFVADPFGGEPGARLYRTGDRARWGATGELEFLGRNDFQVKIRGFRVELGEIEARLLEHPAVREAVVAVRADGAGDRRLVAYVVAPDSVAADELRASVAERLPEYMVPAAYVRLEALPLTPNGKLDRKALPAPEGDAYTRRGYEAPVGETEQALAEIWSELLGVERVGRRDNFFELGGHSLLAVRVISRVRQVLGAEVVLAHVFAHPTVESLAARLAGAHDGQRSDRAIAIRPTGSRPPLFLVYEGTGSTLYAQVLHPHIDAEIPVYALPAPSPSEPALRTVEGMAARLAGMIRDVQPVGPYRLAGWSFGGGLAYEIAAQLVGRDEAVEFVGMFDTICPAGFTAAGTAEARDAGLEHALILHALRTADTTAGGGADTPSDTTADGGTAAAGDEDLETFVRRSRDEGRLPRHVTVAQARAVRDRLRAHQAALGEYAPQPVPVLVHQFPATDSRRTDLTRGWGAFHPERLLRVTPVPGTHLSMMQAPNAATLGEALSRALDTVGNGAAPPSAGVRSPLMTLQRGAAGAAPLFCVPGAGSGVTTFIDLLMALGPSVPVHGLQPRGVDGEGPPHSTVQAAAEHYLRALHEACPAGPVHLLGHSFGGWVALEMALRLHAAGRPVASLTILDSEVPDDSETVVREFGGGEAFLKLVEAVEMAAERSLGIGPADVASRDEAGWLTLLHEKMVALGLLGSRAAPGVLAGPFRTFARCLRTAYRPSGVYPGRLRLVLVDDPAKDEAANRAQFAEVERGWRAWAPGLVFSAGAGNHITALKAPHVAVLAGFLAQDRG